MKILVSGGLGLLGSNVVRLLRERRDGCNVAVADINLSTEQDLRDKSACLAVTAGVIASFILPITRSESATVRSITARC